MSANLCFDDNGTVLGGKCGRFEKPVEEKLKSCKSKQNVFLEELMELFVIIFLFRNYFGMISALSMQRGLYLNSSIVSKQHIYMTDEAAPKVLNYYITT